MSVARLRGIPGFGIDEVAERAGADPEVLRMENLDTDLAPPPAAVAATIAAVGTDEANSYLPFVGTHELRAAVAARLTRQTDRDWVPGQVVITAGGTEGMLDALLATTDPGDEVVLTDPTYAGMTNRVRLAGAVPRLVPFAAEDGEWRLDLDALASAVTDRTRVVFVNNASFPTGWVASDEEWDAIASVCRDRDIRLLYWAGFEGVLFDGRTITHPAALDGMRDLTVTIGCPTLEQRMIAWRIGWIVAPGELVNDVSRAHIYNGLVPSGFNQIGTRVALTMADDGLAAANAEWQRRRDETLRQLDGLPAVRPAGAWSLLLDVTALGLDCAQVSDALLEQKVAATPMRGWGGEIADRHVRFVFSNEPVERLALLGDRARRALSALGST